jgi:hypothetical protein
VQLDIYPVQLDVPAPRFCDTLYRAQIICKVTTVFAIIERHEPNGLSMLSRMARRAAPSSAHFSCWIAVGNRRRPGMPVE